MSIGLRTSPAYHFVKQEADIANLISGDRVKVVIDHGKQPKWMVYGGHDTSELESSTICPFIELPEDYEGRDVDFFRVWESYAKYLQFPGEHIEFNSLYLDSKIFKCGTREYQSAKALADRLSK
jgi:hypothetical protein